MTCVSSLTFDFNIVSATPDVALSSAPFAVPLIRQDDIAEGVDAFYIKFYDNQPNPGDYAVLAVYADGSHYLFATPNDRNLGNDLFCVPMSTLEITS